MNSSFVWGVVIGIGGTWAFHRFIRPIPGKGA